MSTDGLPIQKGEDLIRQIPSAGVKDRFDRFVQKKLLEVAGAEFGGESAVFRFGPEKIRTNGLKAVFVKKSFQ